MQNYYLGLDVGTNSVGWAVTDEHYNLIKAPVQGKNKNHDLWGIRLFESADTAETRRLKRAIRRRLQRRKDRLLLLQSIFAEEMQKVDDTFFIRLNESRLHKEDKTIKLVHPFFDDKEYTDKEYFEEYPTIFHLRSELVHSNEKHDIRLVYLALHNIIKYRGNFLIEGDFSSTEQKDIKGAFEKLRISFEQYGFDLSCKDIEKFGKIILDDRKSRSDKAKEIKVIIELDDQEKWEDFDNNKAVKVVCNLLVGNLGKAKDFFQTDTMKDLDKETENLLEINFSKTEYEELKRNKLLTDFAEEVDVLDAIKAFYDWTVFAGIMGKHIYISDAKVDAYKRHEENLKKLKVLLKKYLSDEEYKNYFHGKNKGKTYANYVGMNGRKHRPIKKCTEEDFYNELCKLLEKVSKIVSEDTDVKILDECLTGAENRDLLPVLRSKDNGSIPRQIHEMELKEILKNASQYLPFLNEMDEKVNKTNIEKIISIFEFRIPYYVGPLSTRHKRKEEKGREIGSNVWVCRKEGKENEKIYPWNFDEVIDKEKSNEQFIMRMTNKCTYIVGEDVLPKNSLLYQKFMVLNELNNLKIRGKEISVELKQEIYDNLFKKGTRVTGKALLNYLNKHHNMELTIGDLTGFDEDFKSVLSTEKSFEKVFDCRFLTDTQKRIAEDIVRWKTVYGDDKAMVRNVVKQYYPELKGEVLKKIDNLPKMSGWGNFSKLFLTQVFCDEMFCQETGEILSIISALWYTNENLMQLLSGRFGYTKQIEKINAERRYEITNINYEECVEDLFTSPSNKRAIWQTILIAEEIKKIMGGEPKKIFVEMARGGGEKGKRTASRKKKLLELYKNCEKDVRDWDYLGLSESLESHDERELKRKKLYLYYLQNGKCAYTGEKINLEELLKENTKWDIDHIFPQSKIDDDSFDNLVLVKKKENAKKDNGLISSVIQTRMCDTWKYWLDHDFISKKKYSRLTKTDDFTEKELSGFIARQIVETRQSTKLIADVFNQIYEDSKVVYVKAKLVSDFRKDLLNVLKSRLINDYHHAKDAYLNIVVGDVYNNKYTDNPYRWIKENRDTNYSITKTMYWDVIDKNGEIVWKGCDKIPYTDDKGKERVNYAKNGAGEITGGDIDRIRKIVKRNTCFYTEYTYCDKGELFNASHERKGSSASKIALKKNLKMELYGGYKSANTSYFALIEFDEKKGGRKKNIVGVPIYIDNMLQQNPDVFKEYCEKQSQYKNVVVLKSKIKKNCLITVGGFPMRLRGENKDNITLKGNLQLLLDENSAETLRLIEKYLDKKEENNNLTVNEKYDNLSDDKLMSLYDILVEKLEGAYAKRPANQGKTMVERRNLFEKLSLNDKVIVLAEAVIMLRCDVATTANLKLLEAGPSVGNIAINKNTLGNSKINLINQSVTGVFENRERL